MHGLRRFATATALAGMTGLSLPAIAAGTGFRIELSEQTGRATIRYGDEAIATATFEPATRYQSGPAYHRAARGGWAPAYGCDPVILQLFGVCGQYGRHGGYGYAYEPPVRRQIIVEDRTVAGESLQLLELGANFLATGADEDAAAVDRAATGSVRATPYDPLLDQWRIYYDRKGKFATSPAPFISTSKLLGPLYQNGNAGQSGEPADQAVRIAISPLTRADLIAWHQKLLNRLGYGAGEPDGVLGPQTRTAIARFEVGMGQYPTGLLNGRVSALLHRVAGVSEPDGGKIVIRRGDQILVDEKIGIKAGAEFGTHVLRLDGEQGWQLLALTGRDAKLSRQVFGAAPGNQKEAALAALARIEMTPEIAARIAELAGPGSILSIGAEAREADSNT